MTTFTTKPLQHPLARLLAFSLGLAIGSIAQAAEIPDIPLQANVSTDPNVMMILDDSGSMHFEIMPDDYTMGDSYYIFPRANGVYGGGDYDNYVPTVDNNAFNALTRSPQVNTVYYNPAVTYTPWAQQDGSLYDNASPTCALHNPMRPGTSAAYCRNLTTNNSNYNGNYWVTCNSSGSCSYSNSNKSYWPATYFWHNGGSIWTWGNYTRQEIRPTITSYSGHGRAARTDCVNGVCTYDQEIRNFANWYTYYRSRILTARAGIGKAFAAQGTGLRVGFGAINRSSNTVDGFTRSTIINGVRQFSGTNRNNFFTTLYGHTIPNAGTPLRRALDDIGQYYSWTDSRGPWSSTPGTSGGNILACRQSYSILMTDGYWNGDQASTNAARGNNDGTSGPTINGPNSQTYTYSAVSPFYDGRSNTLADVASYYWKNDLYPTLANAVPTSTRNPAFWQHMVTFGVGLGVQGSVNPDTAFSAIDANPPQSVTWTNDPSSSNPGKIDDLLHAAVNSRGAFFSAQNPAEFAQALTDMLSEIVDRKSSSGSVSANSTRLSTSSLVFSASFNTSGWEGELEAYSISANGVSNTPAWKASSKIPAAGSRKIFTTSGGSKVEFLWTNLSGDDRTALGSQDVLNYLRGERSNETTNGGTLRKRNSLLGDIVHSSPIYDDDSKVVYIGANDGMLHAFNTTNGVELFAYIPSPMLAKMAQLSNPTYEHKYFVDGELDFASKSDTFLNRSYLVATLGRGGKGLFGLDVTNPASFSAGNVAWEYTSTTDADLGYMIGKPVIARMNDGSVVALVGNGYNSTSGRAVLYMINLATGTVKAKFDTGVGTDNGLATPGVFDANGDGLVDYIYAGDLKGNVWKFDVSSKTSSAWSQSKFFTAVDSTNIPQPITSQINVYVNYLRGDIHAGKRFLFFGTGAYFRKTDPDDKSVQTWYGLIDEGSSISGRSLLRPRTVASLLTADGMPARSFSRATTGDMANRKGWYIDWINPGNSKIGERMITPSVLYRFSEPTLIGSSIIPEADDPCQPGGTGYINAINAFTGASLAASPFVFGNYNGSTIVGSLDLGVGMPSQAAAFITDSTTGKLVASGTGGSGWQPGDKLPSPTVSTGAAPNGRMSWRELSGR